MPDLAQASKELRSLLKKDVEYVWTPEQERSFSLIKKILASSEMVVKPFNPQLRTEPITDASRLHGLGFALLQYNEGSSEPRLIMCGSRTLLDCETRYATIELEALGVIYALEKCDFYLKGMRHFEIATDHKPLLGIFAKETAHISNPRLQRFCIKAMPYNFTTKWIAGKANLIADTLSRAPIFEKSEIEELAMSAVGEDNPETACESMALAGQTDEEYQTLIQHIQSGRAHCKADPNISEYRNVLERLSLSGGGRIVVLDNERMVIPRSHRQNVLEGLHEAQHRHRLAQHDVAARAAPVEDLAQAAVALPDLRHGGRPDHGAAG